MSGSEPFVLYGAPLSLFSGKVRSYLRHSGLRFEERLPSHPAFARDILPDVGRFVLPCVRTPDGRTLQDTTEIIEALESDYGGYRATPAEGDLALVARTLELFGDEGLLRPAMHYRWSFENENMPFLSVEFGRMMNPDASPEEARLLAQAPMTKMKSYLPVLGVRDKTMAVIEAGFAELLARLEALFAKTPFVLGGRPTVADYGLIGPFWAHLGRDPYPANLIKVSAPRVWRWIERMTSPLTDGPEYRANGDIPPGLAVTDEVEALLMVMTKDFLPELKAVSEAAHTALTKADTTLLEKPFPRRFSSVSIDIRGTTIDLETRPYMLWMVQRLTDAYDALDEPDRTSMCSVFERVGLGPLWDLTPGRRIVRRGFREHWGDSYEHSRVC